MTKINLRTKDIRLLFAAVIGGALEFFDFTLFALFSVYIAHTFFPQDNTHYAFLSTFMIFSMGYVMRPIGGLIFSQIGDRISRKRSFEISIYLMALSSLGVALLPGYNTWGITAIIVLVLLRCIQGLAVGGEIPSALVYGSEHFPTQHRGLLYGLVLMGTTFGAIFGSLTGLGLEKWLSKEVLYEWAWRVPFLIGGLIGIVGIYVRRVLTESPEFLKRTDYFAWGKLPILRMVYAMGLIALPATSLYAIYYFPSEWELKIGIESFVISTSGFSAFAITSLLCGYLSDKFSPTIIYAVAAVAVLTILLAFKADTTHHMLMIVLLGFFAGAANGAYLQFIIPKLNVGIRATGTSLSYNFGYAIFSGAFPFAIHALNKVGVTWPTISMLGIIAAAISLLSLLQINRINS
jgi:MFS family permease